ncbi:carboxylate--amine ligase [Bacillus sp. DTU_2020_1000418_1_SI_GHA_SEK_038]|uniref:carboxylate--amine ligase n=1 Tax=Bacillus sp. DTU_2020_1000418_1_SI_GHA_SEK_038 TaxID=3077585 RepID=UPI0028E80CF4|nr:carboxylate--amine ligase [Bacillus sp. DTU_2020_1000418_1_SI_GHA_SEK_038]WNS75872.1 carboxylate--amine ligase [Bacillus sp. DTU_2020_1000418_1_SI_GHA_SEK_038]
MNNKAVILGCNYYIGLSTIRCLGVHGIHTVAVDYSEDDRYGAESKYCSEKLIAPYYKKDPKGFIQFLIEYAKKQSVKPVLIPCHDSYVEIVDEYLDEIREYYLIPQTEKGLYTKVMNKESLHALAVEKGMAVPETVRIDEENFIEKVETVLKYPCIVKPTDSPAFVAHFRRKLFKVFNREELLAALEKAKSANLEVIVQRIIPGFDDHMYTFDAYLDQDAKVTHWVTCQKHRQYPINFGASVYTEQKYVPELYDIGAPFLEAIGFKGFAEIEFKKDAETGKFYLIEINARITNLNNLLYKVGVNFPYITYRELTGSPLEPYAVKEDKHRVFWYAYEDILAIKGYIKTGQLTKGQVIKSLMKQKAYAIWDWSDPKPGIVYFKKIAGKLMKK